MAAIFVTTFESDVQMDTLVDENVRASERFALRRIEQRGAAAVLVGGEVGFHVFLSRNSIERGLQGIQMSPVRAKRLIN